MQPGINRISAPAIDRRRGHVALRRFLLGLAAFTLALLVPVWAAPFSWLGNLLNALLILMFASHFAATLTQRSLSAKRFWLPTISAFALPLAVIAVFLIYGPDASPSTLTRDHSFKFLFSLVALPTMFIISLALIDIRRSREAALQSALDASRRDSELTAALLEMEKKYAQARDIAARRTRQLSTATHDIRQPIASLRAELDALRGEVSPASVDRMDRILNHFDNLTDELSKTGRNCAESPPIDVHPMEDVPAQLLFNTIERMFGAEASARGIDLRFVRSARVLRAPAAALMRICGNLISNAIAHSKARRILVGVRRYRDKAHIIVMDDGIGFQEISVDEAFADGIKGEQSAGLGLGLSIVRELSLAHVLPVVARSAAGAGSAFSIETPVKSGSANRIRIGAGI